MLQVPYCIHLTHPYVLEIIKKQITESGLRTHKKQVTSSGLVTSRPVIEYIRFIDRSVIHAARKIDTRYKYVSAFIFLINR